MELTTIALFGEAEKGEYQKGYWCQDLSQLVDLFGNPPEESKGLYYATQSILYRHPVIYFRVEEEGFSTRDYSNGVEILSKSPLIKQIIAICAPGVGDPRIISFVTPLCHAYHQILITTEYDLIDYLTASVNE